jgi:hypothetical protein
VFYSYLWQDKIELIQDAFKNYGELLITNTQLKSIAEYESFLAKNTIENTKQSLVLKNKEKKISDSIKNVRLIDSLYRDSLIKVADLYKISYGKRTNLSPDISWLKFAINVTERRLNSGNNYNNSNMDSVINVIKLKLVYKKGLVLMSDIIFRISATGEINILKFSDDIPSIYIDQINQGLVGKKSFLFKVQAANITHLINATY